MNQSITLAQLGEAVEDLEENIYTAVNQMVNEFIERTGTSPYCIHVRMMDATPLGSSQPRHIISAVKVGVEIARA